MLHRWPLPDTSLTTWRQHRQQRLAQVEKQRFQLDQQRLNIESALNIAKESPIYLRQKYDPIVAITDDDYIAEQAVIKHGSEQQVLDLWQSSLNKVEGQLKQLNKPGWLHWLQRKKQFLKPLTNVYKRL